jgi:hypothetical protein
VIDLPGSTEKQNKIEAIELEALGALKTSISSGKKELANSLSATINDLTKSGLVSVRSEARDVLQGLQNRP